MSCRTGSELAEQVQELGVRIKNITVPTFASRKDGSEHVSVKPRRDDNNFGSPAETNGFRSRQFYPRFSSPSKWLGQVSRASSTQREFCRMDSSSQICRRRGGSMLHVVTLAKFSHCRTGCEAPEMWSIVYGVKAQHVAQEPPHPVLSSPSFPSTHVAPLPSADLSCLRRRLTARVCHLCGDEAHGAWQLHQTTTAL